MRFPKRRRHAGVEEEDAAEMSAQFRNPFVHELHFTFPQKIKIALMTVTLLPFRLFLAAFWMLVAWPFAFVATVGRADNTVLPPTWWRWVVDKALKLCMRAMWFSGGFHWVRVKGRPALPSEAPILTLAPHSSYFDAIPVTMTMASIVMKAESKDVPIWGTLIKFIRPVFVSRFDPDSRRKTVEEIKRRACSGGEWPQIMIFPEGTCTNRSCLITYKPGAFIPGVPVQPVVLRYLNAMDTITWTWQGPGAFKILWLTLCQLHNPLEIEYLPTYTPSEEEKSDPALFASNVRRLMAKALNTPVTDYSFEDCQLSMVQGPLRLPGNTCLLEFSRLARHLGLKAGLSDKVLQEHGSRARKLWGDKLGLADFAQYVNLPITDKLQDLFDMLDEGTGQMDLRQYVIALSMVTKPFKGLETIQLGFQIFDAEDGGGVGEEDLSIILRTTFGVEEVHTSHLFSVLDTSHTGRLTFEEFRQFVERCPDFVERHLLCSGSSQPSSPSIQQPPPLASKSNSNGFCTDFTPHDQQSHTHNNHVSADDKKVN
ncbi:lysophosphatidylcholine acyltransferase 1 isoform X2 [Engraulis encrasicolus]|uniref:lysophosphatidylcholine acyltransferase 1 isoform X2 n=1 Tax=Engraulis encrasicolus TaxID=184585 RepID=UPI002FD1B430